MRIPLSKIFKFTVVEEVIWYVFLATLAWQTRIILWQADLQFIEWRSMALYASDVLMVFLFLTAIYQGWLHRIDFRKSDILLAILVAAAVISLWFAPLLQVGLYQIGRLVQFMLLFLYLRSWALKRFDVNASVVAFVSGVLLQSVLALGQYILQRDVGIRWMGETLLSTDMRGVAVFYDLSHAKILRAYGTLPHPNVLAVYLMLGFWSLVWLYWRHGPHRATRGAQHLTLLWAFFGALMVAAMEATFSRTMLAAWGMTLLIITILGWRKKLTEDAVVRRCLRDALILVVVVSTLFTVLQWQRVVARMTISSGEEAVQLRLRYNSDALGSGSNLFGRINWTGVGIGNFTTWLAKSDPELPAHLRQPVHNVFLLVYSELGAVGIIALISWMAWIGFDYIKRTRKDLIHATMFVIACSFVFIALFDHFFWTLQQGRILWWGIFAILTVNAKWLIAGKS